MARARGLDRPIDEAPESDSVGIAGSFSVGFALAVMVTSKVLVSVGELTVVVFRGMLLLMPRLALVVKVAVELPAVVVMIEPVELLAVSDAVDSVPVVVMVSVELSVSVPVEVSVSVPVSVAVSLAVAVSLSVGEPEPPVMGNWLV